MTERIVHCLAGYIELGGLQVSGMGLEVLYAASRKRVARGGQVGQEAVVWGGFIWVRVGEVSVVQGGRLMGWRMNGVFGGVCHVDDVYSACGD